MEGKGGRTGVRRRGFFSLYLSIRWLRKGPGIFLMEVLESPGFFFSKSMGTLFMAQWFISA